MSDKQMSDEELGAPMPDEVNELTPEEPENTLEPEKQGAPVESGKSTEQPRDKVIPRERFDEVNAKYRTEREERERLETEIQALKKQPESVDIDALERSYLEASFEADTEKALEIRRRINAEVRRQAEQVAERRYQERDQAASQREAQALLDQVAQKLVAEHPALAEEGSPLVEEVVEYRDFLISKGDAPHIALEKAVARIVPGAPKQATPDPRKAAAVKRGAETENAQPAGNVSGVGNRAMPIESAALTPKQWRALPSEEQERRLAE